MAAAPQRAGPDPAGCPRRKSPFISYGFMSSHTVSCEARRSSPCPPDTKVPTCGGPPRPAAFHNGIIQMHLLSSKRRNT